MLEFVRKVSLSPSSILIIFIFFLLIDFKVSRFNMIISSETSITKLEELTCNNRNHENAKCEQHLLNPNSNL